MLRSVSIGKWFNITIIIISNCQLDHDLHYSSQSFSFSTKCLWWNDVRWHIFVEKVNENVVNQSFFCKGCLHHYGTQNKIKKEGNNSTSWKMLMIQWTNRPRSVIIQKLFGVFQLKPKKRYKGNFNSIVRFDATNTILRLATFPEFMSFLLYTCSLHIILMWVCWIVSPKSSIY